MLYRAITLLFIPFSFSRITYSMSPDEIRDTLTNETQRATTFSFLQALNQETADARVQRRASQKMPDLPVFDDQVPRPARLESSLLHGKAYYAPEPEDPSPEQSLAPDTPAPVTTCNRLLGLFNWAVKNLWPDTQGQ